MEQKEIEKKILDFWEKDQTFQKSLQKESPKGEYVFYDGPPFATGTPHYGHIVASLMKDMVPRYFTMRGFRVERKWGWDCHGLPIENIVEKEHGFKHKKDIEKYGIDKFNEDARSKVLKYASEWEYIIKRLGRWVDFENGYKTMDKDFMESVWWAFKTLYEKGLLYEDYRSMHICPRCETTLAQSEVAQGYKNVKDISVVVKFKVKSLKDLEKIGILESSCRAVYFLAWTTTPWTLPGNVALAVGKKIKYSAVKHDGDVFVLSSDKVSEIFSEKEFEINAQFKGADLEKIEYESVFPYYDKESLENRKNAFKVYCADFVNIEEGTGIVHIAPAFGEDDYSLSKEKKLPFVQHVGMDGIFKNEASDFAGVEAKPKDDPSATDVKIIQYLSKNGSLFSKQKIEHSYPHCWRCDSPLLNYASSSWFVSVEKIKQELLKNAEKISWTPSHIKQGRFGDWLLGARDWSVSRQRFWGSVIPVWECESDKSHKKIIESASELEKLSGEKINDLHKHFVDKITFPCSVCSSVMRRVPDVLDCWFESGSMPYAQQHYPFENSEKFKTNFPAQFIAEGVDQTRAWFYYLHVLSVAICQSNAFKNVIVNGIVLAEDGRKMSKRLKNYPDPMEVMEKHGADAIRYYLASSTVMRAEDLNFSEKGVEDVVKKILIILKNVLAFYKMHELDKEEPVDVSLKNVLDEYILARIQKTGEEITQGYENYNLNQATRPIMLLISDLSTWYVRQSRERYKSSDKQDQNRARATLRLCLESISKIIAPVMPFVAEYIWQEIGNSSSVHLEEWPKFAFCEDPDFVIEKMDYTKKICEFGNAKRKELGIKIRQPLKKITIKSTDKLEKDYEDIVKSELNVKEVDYVESSEPMSLDFDTKITDDLLAEGISRDFGRSVNSIRKKMGLTFKDIVLLEFKTDSKVVKKAILKYKEDLKKTVYASDIHEGDGDEEIEVGEEKIFIKIEKD